MSEPVAMKDGSVAMKDLPVATKDLPASRLPAAVAAGCRSPSPSLSRWRP